MRRIFTDGSHRGEDGRDVAVWAFVCEEGRAQFGLVKKGRRTCGTAEQAAIIRAGLACEAGEEVEILTDSMSNVAVVQAWYEQGRTPAVAETAAFLQSFLNAIEGKIVTLIWVQGHNGDKGNARADYLARYALRYAWEHGKLNHRHIISAFRKYVEIQNRREKARALANA